MTIDKNGNEAPNYFEELNNIDVSNHVEKKELNNKVKLSYLSWPWAWGELKKRYPDATYTVYENEKGWNYFTDDQTCWVKTGVTVCGIEHIEYLPIMNSSNRSLPLGSVTSFDVNKTIQRSITKAIARHGLGLYIYAGEDLPDASDGNVAPNTATPKKAPAKPQPKKEPENEERLTNRDEFRKYIAEKKPSNEVIVEILNKAKCENDSPDEKWFEALCIAKKKLG